MLFWLIRMLLPRITSSELMTFRPPGPPDAAIAAASFALGESIMGLQSLLLCRCVPRKLPMRGLVRFPDPKIKLCRGEIPPPS